MCPGLWTETGCMQEELFPLPPFLPLSCFCSVSWLLADKHGSWGGSQPTDGVYLQGLLGHQWVLEGIRH